MTGHDGRARRILVSTGEASGDEHAAGLVREALARDPRLEVRGIGGHALAQAGATLLHDASEIAVVGITEVLERLPAIRRALTDMKRRLADERPDVLLLVDFPDFNLRLAKVAARHGIPVVYFVSPQVWAWRQGRVETIRRLVSRMIVLFPFEEAFYRERGVEAVCVGHPVVEIVDGAPGRDEARAGIGLAAGGVVYGLLPGSRQGEVRRHLGTLLDAAREIVKAEPSARFVLPVAATAPGDEIDGALAAAALPVTPVRGRFVAAVRACDAAIAASGTATLQLAVLGVPAVVVYRMSPVSSAIARLAVRVPHVSLVNLVAGRRLLPELMQSEFTAARAAEELRAIAPGGPAHGDVLAGLAEVRERLGVPGAYERAARLLLDVLDAAPGERGESAS